MEKERLEVEKEGLVDEVRLAFNYIAVYVFDSLLNSFSIHV